MKLMPVAMAFGVVDIDISCLGSPASLLRVIMFGEKVHTSTWSEDSTGASLRTYPGSIEPFQPILI
jgi:hypothetical protein